MFVLGQKKPGVLFLLVVGGLVLFGGCATMNHSHESTSKDALRQKVDTFLHDYTRTYQKLYYEASLAEWASNTRIVEGDNTNAERTKAAKRKLAAFTGSRKNIEAAKAFLARRDALTPLQVRQLERILYMAADNPEIAADAVRERIAVETEAVEKLFGFRFHLDDREVTANDLDRILEKSRDLVERKSAWIASKEVGVVLRPYMPKLQQLRNQTVRALGYSDFFNYQVSEYGMTSEAMLNLMKKLLRDIWPLYRELHTYIRYELAKRYNEPVPDYIPAHWLPNRWGQDWSALVNIRGMNLDDALAKHTAEWVVRQAERFYISIGFPPLPDTFWERSSLYPVPPGAGYTKNNHASAWHLDLDKDVRSLMSVEPNTRWYETTHHELGHIYYFLAYSRPEVPILLRDGANRAFHEAMGSLMGLAAMQPRFVKTVGLSTGDSPPDPIQTMLKEALNYVVFIPWSAGVMTWWEYDFYARELKPEAYNERWWTYKRRFQGIVPPGERGLDVCDPATKTHIIDDPAQYYDYALSYVLLFQMHDYIARELLQEDPHDTNYFGRKEIGTFLKKIMEPGATVDWQVLLKKTMGRELSAEPMLRYFEPLMKWLKEQNRGRRYTLPEDPFGA